MRVCDCFLAFSLVNLRSIFPPLSLDFFYSFCVDVDCGRCGAVCVRALFFSGANRKYDYYFMLFFSWFTYFSFFHSVRARRGIQRYAFVANKKLCNFLIRTIKYFRVRFVLHRNRTNGLINMPYNYTCTIHPSHL